MKILLHVLVAALAVLAASSNATRSTHAQVRVTIEDRFASVNGVRLHYLTAGKGEPVILLHGYAQNSHMWRSLIVELAKSRLVIAPDLRGFGQSSKPDSGYDKKTC